MFKEVAIFFIVIGLFLTFMGAFLLFDFKVPFIGNLPGDIVIKKKGFELYIPISSCIILSLLLSIILSLIFRK